VADFGVKIVCQNGRRGNLNRLIRYAKTGCFTGTAFFSKYALLQPCYTLDKPLKKGFFQTGEILREESLPKWQNGINQMDDTSTWGRY
jgi:hypothetical protein